MKLKRLKLAAILTSIVSVGAVGQANADIYAGASMFISDFTLNLTGVGFPNVTTYSFNINNSVITTFGNDIDGAACGGQILPSPSTTCNTGAGPVLYSATGPAEVGAPLRGAQNFTFLGPVAGQQMASSDGIIDTAELVDGVPTSTRQIAEAEIETATSAQAAATLGSTTGFTFTFTAAGPGTLSVSFLADPSVYAYIQDPPPGGASGATALASNTVGLTFGQDGTNNSASWVPDLVTAGTCTNVSLGAGGGVGCTSETTTESLNATANVTTLPSSSQEFSRLGSDLGYSAFSIVLNFANAGTYTLGLSSQLNVNVTRVEAVAVPEPGILLLIGSSIAGLGLVRRSQKKGTKS